MIGGFDNLKSTLEIVVSFSTTPFYIPPTDHFQIGTLRDPVS